MGDGDSEMDDPQVGPALLGAGAGHMWKHLHRQRHSGPEGFRRGDRVKMRTTVKGYWDGDDVARVTDSRSKDTDLRTIVLEKNNKAFYAPEWRLTKIGVPGYDPLEGDVAADDPRRDDEDELPWQVCLGGVQTRCANMSARGVCGGVVSDTF